jgi:hypothetical protein
MEGLYADNRNSKISSDFTSMFEEKITAYLHKEGIEKIVPTSEMIYNNQQAKRVINRPS